MNIGYSMNYCSKLLKNKLNKELENEDITVAQFAVIKDIEMNSRIDDLENHVTAVEISERLDMDKPTISGIINRLEDKGYLEKLAHPTDGRSSILVLTDLCVEKLPLLEDLNNKVISQALEGLNEADLIVFQNLLNQIIENIK